MANHDEQVSAPAPRRELRLLCVLVSSGGFFRTYPLGTMRLLPPRISPQGKWDLVRLPGLYLRETQARAPSPEVLELCVRQRQTYALRACS